MENNNKYLEVDERYQNGKIYKVVDNENKLCYVGSTKDPLEERFRNHISSYKRKQKYPENVRNYTVFTIFNKYGFENCKIELVKLFPCANRYFLEDEEQYYIQNDVCVNKNKKITDMKKYNNERQKRWQTENKEKVRNIRRNVYLKKKQTKLEIEFEELSK